MYLIPKSAIAIIKSLSSLELEQTSFYKRLAQQANKLGYFRAEKFLIAESKEENEHFLGWQDYVNGRGNDFEIPSIDLQDMNVGSLYELVELALAKEVEVSQAYNKAYSELLSIDIPTAIKAIDYIQIQTEAVAYYTDACALFKDLDKSGELVAEHSYFEEN